jgi:two-component system sensor histidine kinase/response regulator
MRRQLGDDDEIVADAIKLFLVHHASQVEALTSALVVRDLDGVARAAHAIKGTVGNFAASEVARGAQELEDACATADLGTIRSRVLSLVRSVDQLGDALREYQAQAGC